MSNEFDPIVNNWYHHLETDIDFFVVAVDEDEELIEIQNFDGDIEEVDFDEWSEMDLQLIDTPDDWAGPISVLSEDDFD